MRGQLILIEGLDRSGKSTQCELLCAKLLLLHGGDSKLFKFPDRSTPVGKIIDEYLTKKDFWLSDQLAHLLFSANRWERAQDICSLLNEGYFVVMDRYVYSGVAYSLAKLRRNTSSPEMALVEWLMASDKGLPKPDMTLFLSLDLETTALRKGWGEERYEKIDFQQGVKECFLELLDPEADPSIHFINVDSLDIPQTFERIWRTVEASAAHKPTDRPLRSLT